jgi:hypothetical protein
MRMAQLRFVGDQNHVVSALVSHKHMRLGWHVSRSVVTAVLLQVTAGCKGQALELLRS